MLVEYKIHPAANMLPEMNGAEFEALKEDIRINGQKVSILILNGQILDGRNRYRACKELGIECRVKEVETDDPISEVKSMNVHRRHLTKAQREEAILKMRCEGKSARTIAAAVGMHHTTVLDVVRRNSIGGKPPILSPERIDSKNGKSYPASRHKSETPNFKGGPRREHQMTLPGGGSQDEVRTRDVMVTSLTTARRAVEDVMETIRIKSEVLNKPVIERVIEETKRLSEALVSMTKQLEELL